MATTAQLEESIRQLREDTTDFWAPLDAVPQVDAHSLSPLEFYRRFVSKSVPVVLLNAMESPQWRHVRECWRDHEYLVSRADEDTVVTVDVTPFGYGDAVLLLDDHNHDDAVFAMPEERTMSLREFFRAFHDRNHDDGVPYLSHQNDSLRDEFPRLYEEVPPCLSLAKEAFGNEPEAVNIWIGDERAVSTMHKDHYEVRWASWVFCRSLQC
jgi:peptidyl-lysine (3S)-dioxygenase / protease